MMNFLRVLETSDIKGWQDRHSTLTLSRDGFRGVIFEFLKEFPFDEQFYLESYPDVLKAITTGEFASAWQHYSECGYFEGRVGSMAGFDADKYIANYSDLAHLRENPNRVRLAQQHFLLHGYREGRNWKSE